MQIKNSSWELVCNFGLDEIFDVSSGQKILCIGAADSALQAPKATFSRKVLCIWTTTSPIFAASVQFAV